MATIAPKNENVETVSGLNKRIKRALEGDFSFMGIHLRGEVSNFKKYPSGHCYFSLKDDESVISAVIWAGDARKLTFLPKDGDELLCVGHLSVYPPRGSYQFVAEEVSLYGEGNELAKLRALAEKLRQEGLFDESRKREIPAFPTRIGVIAGKNSAGMKDIVHNASMRWPLSTLVTVPSLVQGQDAPKDLLRAYRLALSANIDVLIIGRGGGSSEDLGAFNDEALVRAVADSPVPVISAVGHEIDTTLIDLVSDKRVSTPTAAAVLATPDKNEVLMALDEELNALKTAINALLRQKKEKLDSLSSRPFFVRPSAIYERPLDNLSRTKERLIASMNASLLRRRLALEGASSRLKGLNPEKVLERGYTISENAKGKVITRASDIEIGDEILTHLKDGIIKSTVKSKEGGK